MLLIINGFTHSLLRKDPLPLPPCLPPYPLTLSPHTMYQAVGTKKGRDRFMLVNTFAGVHITLRSKLPKGRII